MTRLWAKCALCFLIAATVWDAASHRRRRTKREKSAHKEALMEWEQEGGALPSGPPLK
jgi:hypothetical protein